MVPTRKQKRLKQKVLIIKMGYSETLDKALSITTSLGDVLRTTFILNYYKDWAVDWLVDGRAQQLLEHNKYIHRIFIYNPSIINELKKEYYDLVINLEKIPEVCFLASSLNAKQRLGFGLKGGQAHIGNYLKNIIGDSDLIEICREHSKKKLNQHCFQEILAKALNKTWKQERYILGYKPKSNIKYDIGFNWTTSDKWTNKSWPESCWQRLEVLLKDKYTISWQKGLSNIYNYIDWINSCRLVVTADTLGLHICLALGKRVVALFGPTSHKEIYSYGCGPYILPASDYKCIPCLKPVCNKKKKCMKYILPEKVKEKIENEFKSRSYSKKL
ncbi:MAG: glycosyltransferase family 9 protein [Candidatus Omnitrophica bacterium]|nr:glycosyltransferase family 9 protein [Candidatus Omnitrophota bacterium]